MTTRTLAVALVFSVTLGASMAHAAGSIHGTWSTGQGAGEQTFVFRVQGTTFDGVVCGPCDDPRTAFRIADGKVVDASTFTFTILRDDGGPLYAKVGPYRDVVTGTLAGDRITLQSRREGGSEPATTLTLHEVSAKRTAAVAVAAAPAASAIDGKWVAVGRVAQQNVTLKVRGNKVSGVICGPCDDPDSVFLIEDGTIQGNEISFFIHHIDAPAANVQANGGASYRNHMRGTITGNVMRFKWEREGKPEQNGEMTLIGPIRER